MSCELKIEKCSTGDKNKLNGFSLKLEKELRCFKGGRKWSWSGKGKNGKRKVKLGSKTVEKSLDGSFKMKPNESRIAVNKKSKLKWWENERWRINVGVVWSDCFESAIGWNEIFDSADERWIAICIWIPETRSKNGTRVFKWGRILKAKTQFYIVEFLRSPQ